MGAEPAALDTAPLPPLARRLFSHHVGVLLARNTVVSCIVFAVGLAVLWLCVQYLALPKVPAAALSFIVANSLHYIFGRTWIFRGSQRPAAAGYAYFLINATIGLALTTLLYAAFIAFTDINYLFARIIVSLFAGLAVFLLNALWNFRLV